MNAKTPDSSSTRERAAYCDRIGAQHMTPLWEVLGALVPPSPRSPAKSAMWRYTEIREQVMEAGRLISAAEAERRVLILENPALRGQSCITQSLYAGLQLIMPGEVAPAHRYTQSALRLVLAGFETRLYQCTDATVYVCLEGAGEAQVGDDTFRFGEDDVFVVPSWHPLRIRSDREAVMFSYSDRPVQQALGLWREFRS